MVAIKDMEMPKSCTLCDMTYEDRQLYDRCQLNHTDVGHHIRNQTKPAECPLVEIEERKVGKWVLLDECANSGYYCSECHKKLVKEGWSNTVKKINFCPNCGAKMRLNENV